jgi:hypothetical protein
LIGFRLARAWGGRDRTVGEIKQKFKFEAQDLAKGYLIDQISITHDMGWMKRGQKRKGSLKEEWPQKNFTKEQKVLRRCELARVLAKKKFES